MCSDNYRDDNVLMWECVYHIKKRQGMPCLYHYYHFKLAH